MIIDNYNLYEWVNPAEATQRRAWVRRLWDGKLSLQKTSRFVVLENGKLRPRSRAVAIRLEMQNWITEAEK